MTRRIDNEMRVMRVKPVKTTSTPRPASVGVEYAGEAPWVTTDTSSMTLNTDWCNDIVFTAVDLVFKEDGRILLRGKEIATDLELLDALRKNFGLGTYNERIANAVDRQIFTALEDVEQGDLVKIEEQEENYMEV